MGTTFRIYLPRVDDAVAASHAFDEDVRPGDGSETVLNARMEGDLLVTDRVSRRLMLRAGSAVVGVWNDAFDLDGVPPNNGTTVSGVNRALRSAPASTANGHGDSR